MLSVVAIFGHVLTEMNMFEDNKPLPTRLPAGGDNHTSLS